MPVVNPLIFYPWRAYDLVKTTGQWLLLIRKYRRIMKRVAGASDAKTYMDEALRPHEGRNEPDHLVELFADKIPKTHGAPAAAMAD
jgi:hypothetical protein